VAEIPAPSAGASSPDRASSYRRATLSLVALTTSVFISSMTIGLPLPIIPLYVGHVLLFGKVVVGLSVGIQFLATVLTRGYAGQKVDPRRSAACRVDGARYIDSCPRDRRVTDFADDCTAIEFDRCKILTLIKWAFRKRGRFCLTFSF
jgi:hypothetical protein